MAIMMTAKANMISTASQKRRVRMWDMKLRVEMANMMTGRVNMISTVGQKRRVRMEATPATTVGIMAITGVIMVIMAGMTETMMVMVNTVVMADTTSMPGIIPVISKDVFGSPW